MNNIIKTQGDQYIEVQLGVLVFQEEESFIAFCPALQMSTYGESISDVKEAFDDLIHTYLEDNAHTGNLEKDLIAHGWTLHIPLGKVEMPKEINLDIPAGMLRQQYNEPFRIPITA